MEYTALLLPLSPPDTRRPSQGGQPSPEDFKHQIRRFGLCQAMVITPSPHLPAELPDHAIDHLHNAKDTFRGYCLVSKSCSAYLKAPFRRYPIPHSRLPTIMKTAFPDPATFPACCAKYLFIGLLLVVTTIDKYRRGWLDSDIFSHVTLRYLWTSERRANISSFHLMDSRPLPKLAQCRFPQSCPQRLLTLSIPSHLLKTSLSKGSSTLSE